MFDVVIFTAGQSIYAGQLLDILDPNQTLIGQRVYRDSCVFADGEYLKDLTILGRDLARIAIVDNTPQVYLFLSYINYPPDIFYTQIIYLSFYINASLDILYSCT